jgi:hypothetical protein
MNTQSTGLDAIGRATYKLRQAEMALSYLRLAPREIAKYMRRARPIADPGLGLDTFFFSCLGLSKSAFYIILTERRNRPAVRNWQMNVLDQKGRTQFKRMLKLRDNDVHFGISDGKTLPTLIPIEPSSGDDAWMFQQQPNYAALGIVRPANEHKNPDGRIVSSYDGLQGSMGLYVEIAGETCEASDACERFITQLRQMIDAVSAANVPSLRPP